MALSTELPPIYSGLEHALVSIVLALGTISAHDGTISLHGPRSSTTALPMDSPIGHGCCEGDLYTTGLCCESTVERSDPVLHAEIGTHDDRYSASSNLPDIGNMSHHVPEEGYVCLIEVAPGSRHFARARHIIDSCSKGDKLLLAQIYLLMGLYHGQLAQVRESMGYYTKAGRLLLLLIDQYNLCDDNVNSHHNAEDRYRKTQGRIKNKRHNLIILASWACLQLESDVLADLNLPSSGIRNVQHLLPLPLDLSADRDASAAHKEERDIFEPRRDIFIHFTAQSFLTKRLNLVHAQLYGLGPLNSSPEEMQQIIDSHRTILDHWRASLPQDLAWNDSDPPSPDILSARLQARYWSARYIITRPFLDYTLHIIPQLSKGRNIEEAALDGSGVPRSGTDIHTFNAIQLMQSAEIWLASQECILAAARRTIAFDGITERLVTTNIHGTAHAFVSQLSFVLTRDADM